MSGREGVIIELYGIPRHRAGRGEVRVTGLTVGEALRDLEHICPALGSVCSADGRLAGHYAVCIGGLEFVTDLGRPVGPGERLLLISADAGG